MVTRLEVSAVVVVTLTFVVVAFACLRLFQRQIFAAREPLVLCYTAALWTVAVFSVFAWAAQRAKREDRVYEGADEGWFTAGWETGLSVLGVPIDTAFKYQLILLYQILRGIQGSLINNVFRPFLVAEVQSKANNKGVDRSKKGKIILAQSCVTMFGFMAGITDMFLFLAQIDLSVTSLAIALITDAVCTNNVLAATDAPPPLIMLAKPATLYRMQLTSP